MGSLHLSEPDLENSFWYLGHLMSCLIGGSQTGGALSMIAIRGRQEFNPPVHIHSRDSTLIASLDGALATEANGKSGDLEEMGISVLPQWSEQSFRAQSAEFRAVFCFAPAGMEDYFRFLSVPAERLELPPPTDLIESFSKIPEAGDRFGLTWTAYGQPHPYPEKNTGRPFWSNPAEGWKDIPVTRLAAGWQTNDSWDVWLVNLRPGEAAEMGSPADGATALYVAEGMVSASGGGVQGAVARGGAACITGGQVAGLTCRGRREARLLVISSPGGATPDPHVSASGEADSGGNSDYGMSEGPGSFTSTGR